MDSGTWLRWARCWRVSLWSMRKTVSLRARVWRVWLEMGVGDQNLRVGSGDLSVSEVVLNGAPQEILK